MNMLHLEYFYKVASLGSYTKTSQTLRISQPAIGRMVATLEGNLGFKLFEKIGRNIQLTPEGAEVFKHAELIFGEVDKLKLALTPMGKIPRGPLTIGASDVISSYLLPSPLKKILKEYPEVYPQVYSGPMEDILHKIEKGEMELGFFFYVSELGSKLVIHKKILMTFRLVVHKNAENNTEVLTHFIGSREIDNKDNKKFPTLAKLKKIHPKAQIKTSSNNLILHKELVLQEVGFSLLPEFLIEKELKNKTLVDVLKNEKFEFNLKIIKRKNGHLSPAASAFLNGLYKTLEN